MQPISKYGVTLVPLSRGKIEMVRIWRNDPKISRHMQYRGYISPEMQEKWFDRISVSNTDFYFIIEYGGREIGLINIKDVDYGAGRGEQGVFIWDDDYIDTGVAFLAFFALDDFCSETLGLRQVYCHILKSNLRAIRFDTYLGFRLADGQEDVDCQLYTKDLGYCPNKERLLKYLSVS